MFHKVHENAVIISFVCGLGYCRLTGLVCSFCCDFVFTRSGCLKNKILCMLLWIGLYLTNDHNRPGPVCIAHL